MLRMMSDIVPALLACADGQLKTFQPALVRRCRADGDHGDQGLSRRLRQGLASSKDSTRPPKVEGVEIFHAGTRMLDGAKSRQWRPRAEHLRRRQDRERGASPRLCGDRARSTGRKASAAATSAGRRSSGRRLRISAVLPFLPHSVIARSTLVSRSSLFRRSADATDEQVSALFRQSLLNLLRCTRNDGFVADSLEMRLSQGERAMRRHLACMAALRQINPSGKIPLNPSGKSLLQIRPSHPTRGAARDRHERAVGCGGRGWRF